MEQGRLLLLSLRDHVSPHGKVSHELQYMPEQIPDKTTLLTVHCIHSLKNKNVCRLRMFTCNQGNQRL